MIDANAVDVSQTVKGISVLQSALKMQCKPYLTMRQQIGFGTSYFALDWWTAPYKKGG